MEIHYYQGWDYIVPILDENVIVIGSILNLCEVQVLNHNYLSQYLLFFKEQITIQQLLEEKNAHLT
jgi:hypothetical protein